MEYTVEFYDRNITDIEHEQYTYEFDYSNAASFLFDENFIFEQMVEEPVVTKQSIIIPDDVLGIIINYLDVNSVASVRLVNRHLKKLVGEKLRCLVADIGGVTLGHLAPKINYAVTCAQLESWLGDLPITLRFRNITIYDDYPTIFPLISRWPGAKYVITNHTIGTIKKVIDILLECDKYLNKYTEGIDIRSCDGEKIISYKDDLLKTGISASRSETDEFRSWINALCQLISKVKYIDTYTMYIFSRGNRDMDIRSFLQKTKGLDFGELISFGDYLNEPLLLEIIHLDNEYELRTFMNLLDDNKNLRFKTISYNLPNIGDIESNRLNIENLLMRMPEAEIILEALGSDLTNFMECIAPYYWSKQVTGKH